MPASSRRSTTPRRVSRSEHVSPLKPTSHTHLGAPPPAAQHTPLLQAGEHVAVATGGVAAAVMTRRATGGGM